MNKADLINKVHEVLDTTKVEAEKVVDCVFDTITDVMKDGDQVSVAGFGIFEGKMKAAGTARNPRTGETVDVPAKRVPKFKAGKKLKDTVAGE